KEIKRSYQYNQNIINSSLDMIISTDKDMKIVGFNKAAEDTFGYRFSEIEGKDYKILFANEADYFFVYEDTIHKEKSTFEVFNSRSNGEEFECFLSVSVLRDERGSIDGIMSISREITAMKKSEEILRELKEAVETLRLGVTITDIQGNITYTNPADAEIHGYKVAELIGKDARIFAPLTYRKTTSIDQIKKWKGLIRESTNIRKDGSKFPVWLISNVVKDKDGNPTAIVTTCEDITDRKEMEKQLLRSERLAGIGELAAGIAHEIRNPLGNISSSAQFCIRKYNPAKEIKQYLEIIRRNSDNANKIIKELLDFANPREIALKKIHIGEIIDSVIKLVEARSRSHKVYIKPEYLSDIPLIDLDEKWIEQAFLNFVLNSIDAMPNGGELKISVQTKKDKGILEIIFADTGMGISEAKLKKVFDPFFTTKDDGVGLGLSLVHQIIMAHKGKIRIKSEIDKGTQIFVTLPISEG
ncbi:MAG: PAS domain S-box protein, partial [Candidatus Cloacimonetes bacterium]|nr:PAS domain S-box protein [Candidatus Cloacimonadota bacterium]